MSAEHQRQAHAVLDLPSRRHKAMKIERLLGLDQEGGPLRLLEVGCGSGGISHYFATHPSGRFDVHAVDVKDSRLVTDGFLFQQVSGTDLPYADGFFDVVLSNHVIEHVGDTEAQTHHLSEIRRVLKNGGMGYLAVPNRWMLVEPHYRLAFLSWLPESLRSPYLQFFRGIDYYDCRPLTMREIESLLTRAGFIYSNICTPALSVLFDIEGVRGGMQKILRITSRSLLERLNPVMPTLIYKIS